ncbi:MAG: hypothetical protein ACFFDN_26410 [Candidatus Hodarchaeota archaeon]
MNLEKIREAYYEYTRKTSEIIRYLGLAGIALIWIFRVESENAISLPRILLLPTVLLVCGLSLDFLQYIVGSAIWGIYGRIKEKSGVEKEDEFEAPRQINWATNILFIVKIIPIALAYYFILRFLFFKLFQ